MSYTQMYMLCSMFILTLFFLPLQSCVRSTAPDLVLVDGGSFIMGDVRGDCRENEGPPHDVTVRGFLLAPTEVTVAEFEEFVEETGYRTSAEGPYDPETHRAMWERATSGELSRQEVVELREEILRYSGAVYWDSGERRWEGYDPETDWRIPGIAHAPDHPVMAVSWDDAISYCNWLSEKAGLPVAYHLETGGLLDGSANPTTDLSTVSGYRLPTEAESEYAAGEGGRDVRFGTGADIARSSEMNIRADDCEQPYLENGSYREGTTPVESFTPNSLGLYDMSGNAWEWTSDTYVAYDTTALDNLYETEGVYRMLRGGRWGGDAFEARVSTRTYWPRNDRCNNSGFRIVRSKR